MFASAKERALSLITEPNLLKTRLARRWVSPLLKSTPADSVTDKTQLESFANVTGYLRERSNATRRQGQTTVLERTGTRNNWLSKALGFKNIVSLSPFYLLVILSLYIFSGRIFKLLFSFRKTKRNKEITLRKYLQFSWKHMRTFLPPRTESYSIVRLRNIARVVTLCKHHFCCLWIIICKTKRCKSSSAMEIFF